MLSACMHVADCTCRPLFAFQQVPGHDAALINDHLSPASLIRHGAVAAGVMFCTPKPWSHVQVKKYEEAHGNNKSTYWVIFELIWRDFFRCLPHSLLLLQHSYGGMWCCNMCYPVICRAVILQVLCMCFPRLASETGLFCMQVLHHQAWEQDLLKARDQREACRVAVR